MLSAKAVAHLVRYFGHESLVLATLTCGGAVHAHALLEPAGLWRWRVFTPSQAPLPLIVTHPDLAVAQSAARLLQEIGQLAVLLDVPRYDDECVPLEGLDQSRLHKVDWGTTISISNEGNFEGYWQARSKNLRHNIRRYLKRVEAQTRGIQLVKPNGPREVREAVLRYSLLESSGWKGRQRTALRPDNIQGRFYGDLLSDFATSGGTRVYELYIDGMLAASKLMVQSEDMLVALKTTYRESMRSFAPGRLVNYFMLLDVMSGPSPRIIEFFTRANADTMEWATSSRRLADVTIYRSPMFGRAAAFRRSFNRLRMFTRRKAAT